MQAPAATDGLRPCAPPPPQSNQKVNESLSPTDNESLWRHFVEHGQFDGSGFRFRCSNDSRWDSLLSMQSVVQELEEHYKKSYKEFVEKRKKQRKAGKHKKHQGGKEAGRARGAGHEEEEEQEEEDSEEELLLMSHFVGVNGETELRREMDA
jgi:hypothetical protein